MSENPVGNLTLDWCDECECWHASLSGQDLFALMACVIALGEKVDSLIVADEAPQEGALH